MKKTILAATLAGTMTLGGCAALGTGLGGILGDDNNNSGYGYGSNNDFERAAVNACGREASRYGRVAIDQVTQVSRDVVRVVGRTDSRDSRRDQFSCAFRSDNRIVEFRFY
ncbi:MAG: hypothetical protein ACR2FJ_03945 [Qipengyuania sp.]